MGYFRSQEFFGACLLWIVGAVVFIGSLNYEAGSIRQMGPGYFPLVLGLILVALSTAIIFLGILNRLEISENQPAKRQLIYIIIASAAFGIFMHFFGLGPAIVATVIISSLADAESRFLPTIILSVALAGVAWLVFNVGLGLPLPFIK